MNFMEGIKNELDNEKVLTENGAVVYKTTGKKLLDLNFSVSSMRNWSDVKISNAFMDAYYENPRLVIKWLFYLRDREQGLGERRAFRICFKSLTNTSDIDVVRKLLEAVAYYGRWDDLWCLLDTDVKDDVVKLVKETLSTDVADMMEGESVSLLAKWLPSVNTSSETTKRYGRMLCKELDMSERTYRKTLSALRSYIDVVEVKMSSKRWSDIKYESVPSRANLIYNGAFIRNDEERRREFLSKVSKGEAKINASVLFPHDIVHKYYNDMWCRVNSYTKPDTTLEELWKALPDFVNGDNRTIVVADGSGSMTSRIGNTQLTALEVANSLAIYFAERCTGEFKDKYITFSRNPQLVDFTNAKTLFDKLNIAERHNEVSNTNIEKVFKLILDTAINNKMSQDDMPKNILILSDMEFDCATTGRMDNTLFDDMRVLYENNGYLLPRLVFWNICSRTNGIPLKENKLGVALVSGFNPSVVKMVLSNQTDPFECLLETLNSDRYTVIDELLD